MPVMIIAAPACFTNLALGNGRELSLDFAAIRMFLVLNRENRGIEMQRFFDDSFGVIRFNDVDLAIAPNFLRAVNNLSFDLKGIGSPELMRMDGGKSDFARDIVWTGPEIAASQSTTAVMAVGDTFSSTIDPASAVPDPIDIDYIRISVEAGIAYEFTIVPTSAGTAGGMAFVLADAADNDLWWSGRNFEFEGDRAVYTFTDTGDIWIAVFNRYAETGDYTVSVVERALTDDQPDYTLNGSAQALTFTDNAATAAAVIDVVDDVDSFSFETQADFTYIIRVVGTGDYAPLLNPALRLYNEGGTQIGSVQGSDGDGFAFFQLDALSAGTITFDVFADAFDPDLAGGTYQLLVEAIAPAEDLIAGDDTTTATIASGQSVDATLETVTDGDWFRFDGSSGTSVTFTLSTPDQISVLFDVYNEEGSSIGTFSGNTIGNAGGGTLGDLTIEFDFSGVFFVAVSATQNTRGDFTLALTQNAYDVDAGNTTRSNLSIGQNTENTIEQVGDEDWFRVSLNNRDVLDVTLELGTLTSGTVSIVSLDTGQAVASADVSGPGGSVSIAAGSLIDFGELFYVVVESEAGTGTYTVSTRQGDQMVLDQVAGDMTTDQSIGSFGQFESYIDAGDEEDWLSVTLIEGSTETFTLEGLGLLNGSLTLYDANGIEVAYATGPEANALVQLDFDTLSSGQYFIAVSGDFGGTGQYRLRYESDDNDISEFGDDRPAVEFGDVIAGKVNFDLDLDGYTIDLVEGQTIYLYVASSDGVDTYVSIEDEALFGAFSDFGGLGTDAAVSYTAETTGTYNILAGTATSGIGTYELRISNAPLGTDVDDTLFGTAADEFMLGFAGNDVINGGAGADTLDGGDGVDTLSYAGSSAGVTINLDNRFTRGGDAQGDTFINFENITGSDFGDTLIGDALANVLSGGAGGDKLFSFGGDDTVYGGGGGDRIVTHGGDDMIFGEAGNDWMYGQSGDDSIVGGDGNDNFFGGTGTNTMSGDGGNDRFFIDTGGSLDTIDGGDGDDRVVYRNFTTQAVTIDLLDQSLNAGAAAGHTLTNIETIDGTQLADTILGSNTGRDKVFGWDGDDVIDGRDGDDLIWGVDGDDTLNGGAGFDQLRGGSGNDIIDGGDGDDLLDGGADDDTMFGGAGIDKLIGNTGNDTLHGGDGDDRVTGQSGDDILNGDAGDDDVLGADGDDILNGGTGDDFMRGGNDDDVLKGGAGADVMYGDAGADTFVFEAGDSIIGAEDLIRRFEAADTIEIAGHTFVDSNAFSGSGSFEVRYESTAAGTFIEMDRDGDGTADERIDFDGNSVWTFVSDGADITGVVNGPEDSLIG